MPDQGEPAARFRSPAQVDPTVAAVNPGLTAEDVAEIDAAGLR